MMGFRVPLELVRVDDEPGVATDLVVQRASRSIGGMGMPVNAAAPRRACGVVDGTDETAPDAPASQVLRREKVLQVTDVVQTRGAAMKEIVNKTNNRSVALSDEGECCDE